MRKLVLFLSGFFWIGACYGIGRQDVLFYAPFEGPGFAAAVARGDGVPTVEGEVKKSPGRQGGSAAVFRNRGDLLRFAVQGNLNLPQGAVAFWVKELDTTEEQRILNPYFLVLGKDQALIVGRLWQTLNVMGGLWQQGQTLALATGPLAKKNDWQQLIFTWRKNEVCAYVNGVQYDKTSDGAFVPRDPLGTFTLGRVKDAATLVDDWHSGMHLYKDAPAKAAEMKIGQEPYGAYLLDDVAVFNRYLGPAEAKELFEKPMDAILAADQPGAPSLSLQNYSSARKVKVNADFGTALPAGAQVVAEVYKPDGAATGISCGIPDGPGGLEYGYLNTAALAPGQYTVQVRIQAKNGVAVKTPMAAFTIPEKEPWVDNTYGSEDVVLPGFEPLKADAEAVVLWGRRYQFGGAVMPRQITNQGREMLARPMNWYVKAGTTTVPLVTQSSKLLSASPTRAVYETTGTLGELTVRGRVMVEYDGFMKFDLEFMPGAKPVTVDLLYLDIPFTPACATNFFYPLRRSGSWENGWHSSLEMNATKVTNTITVGTPDFCLQWLTESDQYYYPRGNEQALLTFDEAGVGAHVFRNTVIGGGKTIAKPFKLTFALEAGPVKARPANWRGWTMSSMQADLNPKVYNNVQYHYDWWARAPGELIPRTGFPAQRNASLFKDRIEMASVHFAGFRSYEETQANKRTPEWQLHENEWIRIPRMPDEGRPPPGWINTYVDTNSTFSQWHVYNAYKLFSLTGMRGLYYDDWRNGSSMNEAAGSGYIDEDGVRRPTHPIFSQREVHRRVYAIVKKFRPDDGVIIIHTASQTFLPVVAFCDVIYDGEVMIWTDLIPPGGDYFKTFRNDLFQSMFTCKQYGLVPGFHDMTMCYARGHYNIVGSELLYTPNQRRLWAILLTHDIHMHAGFSSGAQELLNVWLDAFGIADPAVTFHAYWEAAPAAAVLGGFWPDGNPENRSKFWASAYAKPGKALVVVVRGDTPSNWAGTAVVKVKLDRRKLGLPDGPLRCASLESLGRSPLGKVEGDVLTVDIPVNDFAGVIIEPANAK